MENRRSVLEKIKNLRIFRSSRFVRLFAPLTLLVICAHISLSHGNGYYNLGAFWRAAAGPTKLVFTTSAQTLNAGVCSGIVTVQGQNAASLATNAVSNITIALDGTGAQYYSDSSCTVPVTSVTMSTGTNTKSFYFIAHSTSTITVAATGLTGASQLETINIGAQPLSGFAYTIGTTGPYSNMQNASWYSTAVLNDTLYFGWFTWGNTQMAPYVAAYNGNDASPAWTFQNQGNSLVYANESSNSWDQTPIMITYGGYIFAAFPETNGSKYQLRVKRFNGTSATDAWVAADSGSLNVSSSNDAAYPSFGIVNNTLYITWEENGLVHVAVYGGGTTWTRIDDNGSGGTNGSSMNYNTGVTGGLPSIYGFNGNLYAAWYEDSGQQIRVKIFNGTSWSQGDNGTGIAPNFSWGYYANRIASFATLNEKLYIGIRDYTAGYAYGTRVLVYAGGTTWNAVGSTLNYDQNVYTSIPNLFTFQGRLYASFIERQDTGSGQATFRIAVYNGNDAAPSWTLVSENSFEGMNYISNARTSYIYQSHATVFKNKIYSFWLGENNTFFSAVSTQNTTPTKLWIADPSVSNQFQIVGCMPGQVRSVDANNAPSFVSSPAVVTLSGTGLSFYSDYNCTQPLASNQVTIATSTSGAHFFYMVTGSGTTFTMGAAATGYTSASRSLAYTDNTNVWVGGASCDGKWSTSACWSLGHGAYGYETAVFNGTCTTNCNAAIDVNVSPYNIFLQSDYAGTVTQNAGKTISLDGNLVAGMLHIAGGTFNASSTAAGTINVARMYVTGGTFNTNGSALTVNYDFNQTGGTFNGNSATTIVFNSFYLAGGTFNSTTATLQIGGYTIVSGSPTFAHSSGTVKFAGSAYQGTQVIQTGTVQFNNVNFAQGAGNPIDIQGTIYVDGNVTINNDSSVRFSPTTATSIIAVKGNVTATTGSDDQGQQTSYITKIKTVGVGVTQTLTSTNGFPGRLEIASTGGSTINLSGTFKLATYKYTSGTVSAGTSTLYFWGNQYDTSLDAGAQHLNNVTIAVTNGTGFDLNVTGTVYIDGNLTISGDSMTNVYGGTLSVAGNYSQSGGQGGTTNLTFTGGNTQTWSTTGGNLLGGTITVNKTVATSLKINNAITAYASGQAFAVTSGSFDLNGKSVTGGFAMTVGASGTVLAQGGETVTINSFTPAAGSNVFYYGKASSCTNLGLPLGATYHHLTFQTNNCTWKLAAATTVNGDLTISTGTLDVTTSNYGLTVGGNWSKSGTFTPRSGTVTFTADANHTISGTNTFYNLTMNNSTASAGATLTFPAGVTTTISHNASNALTLTGASGKVLSLRSSSSPTQWNIAPAYTTGGSGPTLGGYLDVKDSNDTGGGGTSPMHSGANSIDSGNNTNWAFP